MAEAAKKLDAPSQLHPQGRRVTSIGTKDGGVQLGFHGTHTFLPGALKGVEMELVSSMGGVLVQYPHRGLEGVVAPKTLLIPLSHLRQIELAE